MQVPTVTGNATLPRRVKPVPNELLDDYLKRLGDANGINQTRLRSLLERRSGSIRDGLSVTTGMSDRAIAFALPELRVADDATTYPELRGRARAYTTGPGCPQCASRYGIRIPYPHVWSTHDNVICQLHDMWINGTLFRADPVRPAIRILGATRVDILLAHRRHKRLIVDRGRGPVRQAVAEAYDVVQHWNYWKPLDAVEYRLNELEPDPTQHGEGTTCRNAAMYPEVIKVAHLLANPRWRRRALNGPRGKLADAFGELCSAAIDSFQLPYRAYEPLYEWWLRQLGQQGVAESRRTSRNGARTFNGGDLTAGPSQQPSRYAVVIGRSNQVLSVGDTPPLSSFFSATTVIIS